jgi:hypothetical protein
VKIDFVGMVMGRFGREFFDGMIIDDDGQKLDAVRSLDHLVMEYVKVRNGGTSDLVVISPDVLREIGK